MVLQTAPHLGQHTAAVLAAAKYHGKNPDGETLLR